MALGTFANIGEDRHRILVLQYSYHGDTIGAMSVGERGVYNRAYQPLLFDVGTIPFPHEGQEQACLDALEAACAAKEAGDAPAAFIVERSEEHTSELQSLMRISYAVFCLK